MSWTTVLAIYFIVWWLVLFAILPWGIRSQTENGDIVPGTEPGAPVLPRLGLKIIWTTVVSAAVFAFFYYVLSLGYFTIEDAAGWLGMPKDLRL